MTIAQITGEALIGGVAQRGAGGSFKAWNPGARTHIEPAFNMVDIDQIDQACSLAGKAFDAKYIKMQTDAHKDAVALFSTYANSGDDPAIICSAKRLRHFGSLIRIVKNPDQHADGDGNLESRDQDFFHSPKRSFQIARDWVISSDDKRGLSSQTIWQSSGNSRVRDSNFISPRKGGWWSCPGHFTSCM